MTVVNTQTGEIIETLSEREARDAIVEAQAEFKSSIAHFEHAWAILLDALDRGAHRALGYRSESDLLAHEFDGYLNALDVANRRVVVRELSARGASIRAIAPVVGVGKSTVERDAQVSHLGHLRTTPAPSEGEAESLRASGSEGTEARDQQQGPEDYPTAPEAPAATCERPAPDQDEDDLDAEADILAAAELMEDAATNDAPTQPLATVTGIDGKTYTRPKPKPLRPVVSEDEWTEQDRAEELASNLARNLSLLFAVTVPERRAEYIANWTRGVRSRPVLGQNFVTADHMRRLGDALHAFASEWENAHV